MRDFLQPIFLKGSTEDLERALPFTKGGWKPYNTPVFLKEDLEKYVIDLSKDIDKYKFELPIQNINHEDKNKI